MGAPSSHSHQYHSTSLRTTQREVKKGALNLPPLSLSFPPSPKNVSFKAARQGLSRASVRWQSGWGQTRGEPFPTHEAEASISVIPGPALPQQLPVVGPSCGCRRACLVTAPEKARMYLRVLSRHEQKGPGATIKGNVLHSFQKELFPRVVQAQALDDWNSFM